MKCTCPTPAPTPGTQRHLYSTGNWVCVCYPTRRNLHQKREMYMADARNWRHLTQKIPTCWYPCVRWRRSAISCVRWRKRTSDRLNEQMIWTTQKYNFDIPFPWLSRDAPLLTPWSPGGLLLSPRTGKGEGATAVEISFRDFICAGGCNLTLITPKQRHWPSKSWRMLGAVGGGGDTSPWCTHLYKGDTVG